jgi:DnaJ-class molecular chaperone
MIAKKRAIYDRFGYEGLKKGVKSTADLPPFDGGYNFDVEKANATFIQFFGSANPYDVLYNLNGATSLDDALMRTMVIKGLVGKEQIKCDDIEQTLVMTLEDVYCGSFKRCQITRKISTSDEEFVTEDSLFPINIKKGWKSGTKVVFAGQGHRKENCVSGNVVFTVEVLEHDQFIRTGDDLHIKVDISLKTALTGSILPITTLDGRTIHVSLAQIVNSDTRKIIANEGLVNAKTGKAGSLVISFNINFPTYLDARQKKLIEQAFTAEKK